MVQLTIEISISLTTDSLKFSNNLLEGPKTRVSISCHVKPTCKPTANSTCIFKDHPRKHQNMEDVLKSFDEQPAQSLVPLLRYKEDPSVFPPSLSHKF